MDAFKNGLVMKVTCDHDKWREVVKSMTIRNPANGEENGLKVNRRWRSCIDAFMDWMH